MLLKKILKELGIIVTQFHNSPYPKPFSFVYIELLEASSSCRRLKPNLLDTAKSHYKLTCAIDFLHPLAISYMAVPTYLLPIVYRILFFFLNTVWWQKKSNFYYLLSFVGYRTTWQFHFNLTLIIKVDKKLIGSTCFIFDWQYLVVIP